MSPSAVPPLPDATHVLVAAPPIRSIRYEPCRSLSAAHDATTDVLYVSYRQPVPAQFADVEATDADARRVTVVDVGPDEPGAALERRLDALPVETAVTSVSASDALPELGMTIEGQLREYADAARPIELCFDSLTSLCLYAGPEQSDRFLSWLCSRVDAVDGRGHYHADPSAHEWSPGDRFGTHFDATVEVRPDGTVETDR